MTPRRGGRSTDLVSASMRSPADRTVMRSPPPRILPARGRRLNAVVRFGAPRCARPGARTARYSAVRPADGPRGGVPEWLNGAVSKTVVGLTVHRGFESLPLRSCGARPQVVGSATGEGADAARAAHVVAVAHGAKE